MTRVTSRSAPVFTYRHCQVIQTVCPRNLTCLRLVGSFPPLVFSYLLFLIARPSTLPNLPVLIFLNLRGGWKV